jgi:hypothetical protein
MRYEPNWKKTEENNEVYFSKWIILKEVISKKYQPVLTFQIHDHSQWLNRKHHIWKKALF